MMDDDLVPDHTNSMDMSYLAPGLSLRNAEWTDLEPVAQLILDECTAGGDPGIAVSADDLREEWNTPGFSLQTDAWVVTTNDGRVVGFEEFVNRYEHASLQGDGYVHPEFLGQGIGTTMMRALEGRARAEMELADPEHRVFIRNGLSLGDKVACDLHQNEGYKPFRFFWRMEIDLDKPPPAPVWPEGVMLRPFDKEQHNYMLYRAHHDAFGDHWGHTPRSYEDWQHRMNGPENDTTLWYIAWSGDEIAGYSLCKYRMDNAWVGTLGVRRPWRKRGLGLALLLHSFREFHKRGHTNINLGVDAANPTGATRLYQKAGMQVGAEYVTYEKELRPGKELVPEAE